jgi:Rrf2 family iron-sulfur cluster assembly transcriptional regulator
MRLTRAGEYGVRCVLYLSKQKQGIVVPRREISEAMEIPGQFLGKIAQQLARRGIIEIVQGSKGGFRLVVDPARISLLEVVEAVVGEIFLNDCLMRPNECSRVNSCTVHRVWQKARTQLRETLSSATFAELVEEDICLNPKILEKKLAEGEC